MATGAESTGAPLRTNTEEGLFQWSGHYESALKEVLIPESAVLYGAFLGFKVYMHNAKGLVVTFFPFQIIQ